jgi:signal transduction histidine kinase
MKPSILLRIGSVASLLYFAGQMMGVPWTPSQGPKTAALLETMKAYRFDVTGSSRTYWDFYLGFGLIIGVHLLVQTVALWHLGTMAKRDASSVRLLIGLFGLALVANAILAWRFFFAVPLMLAIAIAICLGLAFVSARTSGPAVGTRRVSV